MVLTAPTALLVAQWEGGLAGLVAGTAFSLVSAGAGYHWVRWSVARGDRAFLAAVLGGMLARMMAVVVFALALAFATEVDLAVALLTVAALHVVFGIVEMAYFHTAGILE